MDEEYSKFMQFFGRLKPGSVSIKRRYLDNIKELKIFNKDNKALRPAILIQENTNLINLIPEESPFVELKSYLIIEDKIPLVCLHIVLPYSSDLFYECWLNYYSGTTDLSDPSTILELFKDFKEYNEIVICFFNGEIEQKMILINNSLKSDFGSYIENIKTFPIWTMKQFDIAKEKAYLKYPDPLDDMWNLKFGIKILKGN